MSATAFEPSAPVPPDAITPLGWAGVIVGAVVVVALIVWWLRRHGFGRAAPPLVIPSTMSTHQAVPLRPLPPPPAPFHPPPAPTARREPSTAAPSNGHGARESWRGAGGGTPTESVSSRVIHTAPTMDGTLQFLPGRLEVVDGERPGQDIRFVRTWGEVPEVTFGRVTGPPYRHIQLKSQTVSRQHARLQYLEGRWCLTNLSQTNPVIVNGATLDSAHGQHTLRDGDEIEMGEVVFRFHER